MLQNPDLISSPSLKLFLINGFGHRNEKYDQGRNPGGILGDDKRKLHMVSGTCPSQDRDIAVALPPALRGRSGQQPLSTALTS